MPAHKFGKGRLRAVSYVAAQQFGIGIAEKSFNLDRLSELPDHLPVEKFHNWVNCAPEKLFAAIEQAVHST